MTDFSDFTKLVLDRMETNPDEFVQINGNYTRWQGLINGLEELARNDTDGRFIKTLWPLSDEERAALLEQYRKIYLAALHKDMLKNIVSGNDKEHRTYQYTGGGLHLSSSLSNDINPLKGQTLRGNTTPLTATGITNHALGVMEASFDESYTNTAFGNAIPKVEGAPVKAKYQTVTLTPTQIELAKRFGISPTEYARRLAEHEASNNN